jgi:hypothetical protein
MAHMAANCAAWGGAWVCADSAETFVADLIRCGFLQPA